MSIYPVSQSFLLALDGRHHGMNPKNIVKDAIAISRLLIVGSSPCLVYNFGKLLSNSRSLIHVL